jgi:seryl-tRNA synthetase
MLDIKLIREKPELVEENLKRRHNPEKLKQLRELIKCDKEYRETLQQLETLKHKKNLVTREIAKTRDKKKISEMKKISSDITILDKKQDELKQKTASLLLGIPNLLHESVPYGKDENDNKEIRTWGKPPKFSFKPKNHLELLQDLDLVDADRAAKVAGDRKSVV